MSTTITGIVTNGVIEVFSQKNPVCPGFPRLFKTAVGQVGNSGVRALTLVSIYGFGLLLLLEHQFVNQP
jgi:hypothetical protein